VLPIPFFTTNQKDVVFYLPIHSNLSQVESTLPFLTQYGGKVFIYNWNDAKEKMTEFYNKNFPFVKLFDFTRDILIQELIQETKKVVFLITAALSYCFGTSQLSFLQLLQQEMPDKIIDIFAIGHCLYGCNSCKNHHNIPIYFTRYYRGELPYNAQKIRDKYQNPYNKEDIKHVLVCPSTSKHSQLARPSIANEIVQLYSSNKFNFVAKLHASVFRRNLFYRLSPEEQETVNLLQNLVVTDEDEYNVLPFLEAFDLIIVDLDSSVAFETLYFQNKVVLAFDGKTRPYEEEYKANFHVFQNEEELKNLLCSHLLPKVDPQKSAEFFQSKYGKVNGDEVEKIFSARGWHQALSSSSPKERYNYTQVFNSIESKMALAFPNIKVVDLLATGAEFPIELMKREVLDFLEKKGKTFQTITREDIVNMADQFDLSAEFVDYFITQQMMPISSL